MEPCMEPLEPQDPQLIKPMHFIAIVNQILDECSIKEI